MIHENLDDVRNEKLLVQKSAKTIQRKIKSKSFKELLEDEEFGNSIFQRFAASGLPLREGNKEANKFFSHLFYAPFLQKTFMLLN